MVVLLLQAHRGNSARTFPCTGFLGLSDVTLAGVVRTKIEEDKKPIEASSLVVRVRCYESLGASSGTGPQAASTSNYGASTSTQTVTDLLKGQSNGKGRVLYEKSVVVWTAEQARARAAAESSCSEDGSPRHNYPPRSRGPQYASLGDLQQPWRLVIPPQAVLEGAKSTMIFKTWRIWWAVEAVISHRPSGIHGDRMVKSHQVALINHAAASASLTPLQWLQSPSPSFDCQISGPTSAFGASDPLVLSLALRRNAKSEAIKKVSVELRREILYTLDNPLTATQSFPSGRSNRSGQRGSIDGRWQQQGLTDSGVGYADTFQAPVNCSSKDGTRYSRTPPQNIPTPIEYDETQTESYFSMFPVSSSTRSTAAIPAVFPSLPYPVVKEKKEDVSLATFETDVTFSSDGSWQGHVKGAMPKAKSLYHYALGESCTTKAASSRFYLIVRIHHRQRNSFVELPHRTISFTTVSAVERVQAVQQLPRIHAIQNAEAKLFGHQNQAATDDKMSEDEAEEFYEDERVKLSTVRRRSEQPEGIDSPRAKIRFGSVPPLDPVDSASDLPLLNSPALSGASTVTQRPRTATSRRHGASLAPHRSSRPRSSGGASSSASLRSARSSSHLASPAFTANPLLSPLPLGSLTHSRSSPQLGKAGDAATTGLFANFAGFTLRPPEDIISSPSMKEQDLPPKPGVIRPRSSRKADPTFTYEPPVLLNYAPPSFTSSEVTSTSSSSGSPSPPPAHQSTMSRTASSASVLEPITNNSIGTRRKSGLAAGFSFFRRSSKV